MMHRTRPAFPIMLCSALALGILGVAALSLTESATAAKKFPSRTIELVTHAGAGGGTDLTTRMMALRARRVFKVNIVIVNKRGGSGVVAHNYMKSRPRDGYTIGTLTATQLGAIARGKSPLKLSDIEGLARATEDPQILMVSSKGPYKTATARQFIEAQKKKKLKFGVASIASEDHVTSYIFAKKAGAIQPIVVPFGGGGNSALNLVGGTVQVSVLNYSEGESLISAGKIRPIIVFSAKRMAIMPEVPTGRELGIDMEHSTVRGFYVLKGTPKDRMKILEKGMLKAMKHKVYQGFLKSVGLESSSVAGRKVWDAQIRVIYKDFSDAMRGLGMLK